MNHNQHFLKIKNLVKNCDRIEQDLNHLIQTQKDSGSAVLSPTNLRAAHQKIKHFQEKTAAIIEENNKTAADLPIRTRRAYQWLSFLCADHHFHQHIQALEGFYSLYQQVRIPFRYRKTQPFLSFFHISPLYQIQLKDRTLAFRMQESFIAAHPTVYLAILQTAYGKNRRGSKNTIQAYTRTAAYRNLRKKLEYLQIPRGSYEAGKVVDLGEVFNRVNKNHFQGSIARPHLVWSTRPTYRKFGHYAFDTDTVMISTSLDSSQVPDYVLDYIMYHEILHKKMGIVQKNGQNVAHTPEYNSQEKQFPSWSEAQDFLERYAQHLKRGR